MNPLPGSYEFLPHTADAKFRAYGESLEECFRNAGKAMTAILTDEPVKPKRKFPIELKAKRRDSLLFDFLDKLLFFIDTEDMLFADCADLQITEKTVSEKSLTGKGKVFVLTGIVMGDSYKAYETHGDIKAVTYNDMDLKEENGRWTAQVVVDL